MLHSNPLEISKVTYPWCFKDNIFNTEELTKIINFCDTLDKDTAKTLNSEKNVYKENKNVRISEISWINLNLESQWFVNVISNTIDYLNQSYYGYELNGFEPMQYAKYNSKDLGKYDYHMDMELGLSSDGFPLPRKLSSVLLLSDNFKGGEFEFGESFRGKNPALKPGTLIVFPSFMVHRVKPVVEGIRHSITTWCVGPKFK